LSRPRLSARLTALLAAAVTFAGCGLFGDSRADRAQAEGRAFLADWQAGRLTEAAARTSDPNAAAQALREVTDGLRVSRTQLDSGDITGCEDAAPCVLPFTAQLDLASLGRWRYASSFTLTEQGERWVVAWAPSAVHPTLTAQTRLRRVRELPERAPILDRDGRPLAQERPVVTVGIVPGRLTDATRAIAGLARTVNVDPVGLAKRVQAAKPDAFVEVITLRKQEYDAVAGRLRAFSGVTTRAGTLPLGPTRSFARGVLGAVAPATKESLASAGPDASPADYVGSSGLQRAFQRQLAGAAGGSVQVVDRSSGTVREAVAEFTGRPGTPLRTTLAYDVQDAAERAIAPTGKPTAIVAVDTATGGILAVANGPALRAADNRALSPGLHVQGGDDDGTAAGRAAAVAAGPVPAHGERRRPGVRELRRAGRAGHRAVQSRLHRVLQHRLPGARREPPRDGHPGRRGVVRHRQRLADRSQRLQR